MLDIDMKHRRVAKADRNKTTDRMHRHISKSAQGVETARSGPGLMHGVTRSGPTSECCTRSATTDVR